MERFGQWESSWQMLGILIVATEPVAASRRCGLLSFMWSEALKDAIATLATNERLKRNCGKHEVEILLLDV